MTVRRLCGAGGFVFLYAAETRRATVEAQGFSPAKRTMARSAFFAPPHSQQVFEFFVCGNRERQNRTGAEAQFSLAWLSRA